jgi:hypothetical protein
MRKMAKISKLAKYWRLVKVANWRTLYSRRTVEDPPETASRPSSRTLASKRFSSIFSDLISIARPGTSFYFWHHEIP